MPASRPSWKASFGVALMSTSAVFLCGIEGGS